MEGDLLKIIIQIEKLIDAAKGLPSNPLPPGVNPAPDGSSFDNKSIPPTLSTNEKSRVREVAKIFRDIMMPGPEARRINVRPMTRDEKIEQNLKVSFDDKQMKKGGSGIMGIISGLLGGAGGIGGGTAIAASSLPILAGAVGVAIMALAGGKSFQWIVEGLKAAKDVDWDAVNNLAGTVTGVLKDIAYVVKDLITHFVRLGVEVAASWFDMWRKNIGFFIGAIGDFGDALKRYNGVKWEDLGKAGAAIAGLMATMTAMGSPPLAIFEALGNLIFTWTNMNLDKFGKNLILITSGLDEIFATINKYKDVDALGFAKMLASTFVVIGNINLAGLSAPLTALGSFTTKIAALGLDKMADTLTKLSVGLTNIGNAQKVFADGIRSLQGLDPKQLHRLSEGVTALGLSLASFSVGQAFSNFFQSQGLKDIIKLAEKHAELNMAAASVQNISDAFKEWSNLRLDNLQWNLRSIQESVDKLDIRKLERALTTSASFNIRDDFTKGLLFYLVTGKAAGDTGDGLLSITREILEENRKLNTTVIKIKDAMIRLENRREQPGTRNPLLQGLFNPSQEGRRTTRENPRDSIRLLGLESR